MSRGSRFAFCWVGWAAIYKKLLQWRDAWAAGGSRWLDGNGWCIGAKVAKVAENLDSSAPSD